MNVVLIFVVNTLSALLFERGYTTSSRQSPRMSAETAGFGVDDSELEIWYITTPNMKANHVEYKTKKFEFPKKYDVRELYRMLQELAYENFQHLNK